MSRSKPIRILFICHDGTLYGSQQSLKRIIEGLPAEQYEIFVSFAKDGELSSLLETYPHVTVLRHKRIPMAKHAKRSLFQRLGDMGTFIGNLSRALHLVQVIHQYDIDLVHTNSLISFEGAWAAKLSRVPHVWHIRERFVEPAPRFRLTWGRAVTKSLVQHFSSRVLCISNTVYQQFHPNTLKHPEQYQILYNAIECTPDQRPVLPYHDTRILRLLYLGRLSDGKHFQDIVNAFVILKARIGPGMPYHLKAYGDFICPQFEAWVRKQIVDYALEDYIQLLPYQSNIDSCFTDRHALIMPSSDEAFGRTMLDALVRGFPVIAPRTGAPLEVIEEGKSGFFYDADSASDLGKVLTEVYEKRHSLVGMQKSCIARVQELFRLDQQLEKLNKIYHQLAKRPLV